MSGTGSTNNNNFKIVGNTLKTKTLFTTAGSRSIRVRVTDQGGLTYDKIFTITLTESNRPPTNISLTNAAVNEKQASNSLVGNLSTADLDSATFTYSLVSGSGSTNNNNFKISGTQLRTNTVFSSHGLKYVRIRTTDQNGASFEKSFTITVNNINENPTGIGLSNSDISDKSPAGTVVGSLSSTDPDSGNSFTYSLVYGTGSTNNSDFQIAGNQLKTKALFSSDGSKSIRIRTTDQGGRFYEKSFTILVAVNNPPHVDSIADISILEDASEQTLSLTGITAGFNESQPLRISATSSNTGLLADPVLTYSSPTTTGTLRFTPTSNQFGFTTITVTVEDAGIDRNFSTAFDNEMTTQAFDVTVTPVNDAPVLNDIAVSTNEEEYVDISLTGTDVDSTTLTYTVTGNPTAGSVSVNNGVATYTPNTHFFGTDSFVITVSDNHPTNPLTDTATVTVTVANQNDAPTLDTITDISILEDAEEQTILLSGITDGPNESQPLRVIATSSNAGLIADPVVTYASPDSTGSITFTPVTDHNGTATITVIVEDSGADGDFNTTEDNLTVSQSFDVTVTPVNDAPVLNDIAASTNEEESVDISLTGSDVDSTALTYTVTGNPTAGSVSVNNGVATYTPNTHFFGTDSFVITVSDNHPINPTY